jgi:GntR family transcriptional regulator, transcriptional repressor for pyruvate dehydrogenase complex
MASVAVTRAHDLADQIRLRIQAERLADGVLFMTADQLASEYGVSRTVAREAISRLQALGILEGKKRKGLIIRRPDLVGLLSRSIPSLVDSVDDWRELGQLRFAIEVGAIDLAVRNGTSAQIERLEEITTALEQALQQLDLFPQQIALDVEFHSVLLEMTGSRMIAGMQQVLLKFFQSAPHAPPTPEATQRILWEHRELFHAVRDRDVERARTMMRLHFRSLIEFDGTDAMEGRRGEGR